ncbi:alpha/beta fold hydrolase [Vitiosangium sp. GDMCC 1.1324]|uniref:alpha/beta fold hydrolase n=1 Tax=Vitiosangium sp. (strain GDMCC 1.1324) TaxID=2138576 RepID=UPI000D38EADC|nr:alpha/beta hydrolase [Vitiosangium sp. GDMCC 1.1324]PTL83383.1 alpha/beta hydrolase [Vitiosangium sp. GDMCC 1.1324]
MRKPLTIAIAALALGGSAVGFAADAPTPPGVKNIVIVPGAFVDGSGWRVVHDILIHKGYTVSIVQPRIETLADDIELTHEQVRKQNGPVVLVGHSYGGAVITQAGNRDKVKALVYVAAVQPNVGESLSQLVASMPSPSNDVVPTRDGHLFFDESKYGTDFAGDLTKNRTDFMAVSQVPATTAAFGATMQVAAWLTKPTWGVVATEDRALSPDLQRWMYKRAGSKVTEIKASHVVYISQPEKVAEVIEEAAKSVK